MEVTERRRGASEAITSRQIFYEASICRFTRMRDKESKDRPDMTHGRIIEEKRHCRRCGGSGVTHRKTPIHNTGYIAKGSTSYTALGGSMVSNRFEAAHMCIIEASTLNIPASAWVIRHRNSSTFHVARGECILTYLIVWVSTGPPFEPAIVVFLYG